MKKILTHFLIFCLSLLFTSTYSQTCSRQIAAFDSAPGGYSISGSGLLESENDATTLSFDNAFGTQSGPDLHVYLAINFEAPSVPGNTNIDLGELTSNSGAQSYSVPSGVGLGDFNYVLIHCKSFNHWWGGGLLGDIDCSTATDNVDKELSASIYPNPTKGIIYFPEIDSRSQLMIYDFSGKLILNQNGISFHQLDISKLGSGIYLLKLVNENGTTTARVVIE